MARVVFTEMSKDGLPVHLNYAKFPTRQKFKEWMWGNERQEAAYPDAIPVPTQEDTWYDKHDRVYISLY